MVILQFHQSSTSEPTPIKVESSVESSDSGDISIIIDVPKPGPGSGLGNGIKGTNPDIAVKRPRPKLPPRVNQTSDAINGSKKAGVFVRADKTVISDVPVSPVNPSDDSVYDNPNVGNRLSPSGKPLKWYEQAFNPRSYAGAENLKQIAVAGGKTRNDILVNEMIYSDFNRLPPSFNDKDFEYGYSFLPPKDWYPLPPYPPVCVSNTSTPPQPVYLDTTTMDLKEWYETQKITPSDSFNTDFLTNELNSKF